MDLSLPAPSEINAVMTREDLSQGQAVANYTLQYQDSSSEWHDIKVCVNLALLSSWKSLTLR